MKIALAIYSENIDEFRKAVGEFKNDDDFSASLSVAQEFYNSGAEEYIEYLDALLCERPALLTVYRKEYGQPIFRQIFKNGSEKSIEHYLNYPFCDKEMLSTLLADVKEWHEHEIDNLQEIREIKFSSYAIPFLNENEETDVALDDFVQDDPRYIIRHLNIVVRQRRMIKKMQERLINLS